MAHEGSSDLQYYDEFLTVSPAFILITFYIRIHIWNADPDPQSC